MLRVSWDVFLYWLPAKQVVQSQCVSFFSPFLIYLQARKKKNNNAQFLSIFRQYANLMAEKKQRIRNFYEWNSFLILLFYFLAVRKYIKSKAIMNPTKKRIAERRKKHRISLIFFFACEKNINNESHFKAIKRLNGDALNWKKVSHRIVRTEWIRFWNMTRHRRLLDSHWICCYFDSFLLFLYTSAMATATATFFIGWFVKSKLVPFARLKRFR